MNEIELKKIEDGLAEAKVQKEKLNTEVVKISTDVKANAEELKKAKETFVSKEDLNSAKEGFVSKEEIKSITEELELAKVERLEYKTALDLEKKDRAALFAKQGDTKESKENARKKIVDDYEKSFAEALRTKSKIDSEVLEKAAELYARVQMGSTANEEDIQKVKSEILSDAKTSDVPLLELKTLREGVNPDGGYVAKRPELGATQVREFASLDFRSVAFTQNISSESIDFPIDDGLFAANHYGEESVRALTDTSQFGKVSIKAGEIWAEPLITLKMIEDSAINITAWISTKTSQAFELIEEQDFMVGTGLNDRAKGLFTYDSWSDETVYERNALATLEIDTDTELADAIIDIYEILPNRAKANAVYLMNPTTWRAILRLKDGVSRYLLNANMLAAGYGKTLYGRPVILSDYILPMFTISKSTVTGISGVKGIACGDMRETYAIVDRIGLTRLTDPYTQKGFIKYSSRKRVGGGVKNFQTCKFLAIS